MEVFRRAENIRTTRKERAFRRYGRRQTTFFPDCSGASAIFISAGFIKIIFDHSLLKELQSKSALLNPYFRLPTDIIPDIGAHWKMATVISSRPAYMLTVAFDGTEEVTEDGKSGGKRTRKTKDASLASKLASGGVSALQL